MYVCPVYLPYKWLKSAVSSPTGGPAYIRRECNNLVDTSVVRLMPSLNVFT